MWFDSVKLSEQIIFSKLIFKILDRLFMNSSLDLEVNIGACNYRQIIKKTSIFG